MANDVSSRCLHLTNTASTSAMPTFPGKLKYSPTFYKSIIVSCFINQISVAFKIVTFWTRLGSLAGKNNVTLNYLSYVLQPFRKTVNTRENFWNVYSFATNHMRDETAKDNGQTAAGISHELMQNNELALSSTRNLQFSLCISLKRSFFLPQTST